MSHQSIKTISGGCFFGLWGAVIGALIGGWLGPVLATSNNVELRNNPDPQAKAMASIFDGIGGFVGLIAGVVVGSAVGGIGGAAIGATLLAKTSRGDSSNDERRPESISQVNFSQDDELAQLKQRVEELENKKRRGGAM